MQAPATEGVEALLFDLDGTLTDSFEGIANCLRYAVARMGLPEPDAAPLRACAGPPLRETLPRLIGTDDSVTVERALGFYRERFADVGWRENAVYPGVADMLDAAMHTGRPMFVCTSKPQRYAEMIVAHFGLSGFFARIYGPALDGALDDKAKLLAHLLAAEGLAGARVVMVGDRMHDIRAARRNGARSIGVLWGYGSHEELTDAGADKIIRTPLDLAAALTQLQPASS
jgi:phosphoglycolate phosphatase